MAIILIFLTSFYSCNDRAIDGSALFQIDSLKKERHPILRDTTGRFVIINRVFIIGNRLTRDGIVIRELTLKPGDVIYNLDLPSILALDKEKLINTRLFNTVEIRTMDVPDNKVDLLVDLRERWYTFPAPLFDLADRNFNDWWQNYNHDFKRVNYGLRLYQYNMRGRNETLRFVAQFGFQRKFELMYRFPYIDKKQKHGITIDMSFFETKNLAVQTLDHKYQFAKSDQILRNERNIGVIYSYRNSFYQTHSFDAQYHNIHINQIVADSNANYFQEFLKQAYTSASYQFSSDHRDVFSYPLKGDQFIFRVTQNGLATSDDVKKFELNVTYSKYFELKRQYYLSDNLIACYSSPGDVPYVNYSALGLRKQFVRGYELYVVEGPYYFLNKTTFKKLIFSRRYHWALMPAEQFRYIPVSIYVKTYADLGYVENYPAYRQEKVNTRLSDKLLAGTGFGLDIVGFYDIVIRFEYTFNAEGEQGFFFHVKKEF